MPYAVTCPTCRARFSVADDLYQRRFAGRIVTVRCKRCESTIRLDASESPPPLESHAAAPPPRPKRPPPPPRPPHPRGQDEVAGPSPDADVDADADLVDLTEFARSEPPSALELGGPPPPLFFDPPLEPEPPPANTRADAPRRPTPEPEPRSQSPESTVPDTVPLGPGRESAPPARRRRTSAVLFATGTLAVGLIAVLSVHGWRVSEMAVTGSAETVAANAPAEVPREPPTSAPEPSLAPGDSEAQREPASATPARAPRPAVHTARTATPAAERARPIQDAVPPVRVAKAPSAERAAPTPIAHSTSEATAEAAASNETSAPQATEPFNRDAAASALAAAAEGASACRQEGDPSGTATVTVTFAPSGRVTTATISGPPFAGTKTGGCIAASLRRARVPPFAGDTVTVGKTVVIR